MTRRRFVAATGGAIAASAVNSYGVDSSKRVVLTFDDAVKSHRTFVAPLLKELGFNATFYVTHRWMDDAENFMTWEDIAEIHEMGFEIGNHTWTHSDASIPRTAGRFAGELALIENALEKVGVPRPTSLAWCGNSFGPEALGRLRDLGYRFARRVRKRATAGSSPAGSGPAAVGTTSVAPASTPTRYSPIALQARRCASKGGCGSMKGTVSRPRSRALRRSCERY